MFRIAIALSLAMVAVTATAARSAGNLQHSGVAVDFARWAVGEPVYHYDNLDISEKRLQRLVADGHHYVDRLYRIRFRLRSDGSVEKSTTLGRFYLTQNGVRDAGDLSFWVNAANESAEVTEAFTLVPDGRHVPVDQTTVQMVADDSDNIFTDSFRVVVPYRGLEPNTVAVLSTRTLVRAEGKLLPWSYVMSTQWFRPIEEIDFEVRWDEGVAAPQWKKDDEKWLKCDATAERRLRCRAFQVPPISSDPDFNYRDVLPLLVVSEATSWADLAHREKAYVQSVLGHEDALGETALRVVGDASSPEDKLQRLHAFVSQKIRYLGLEHGAGGIVPRPPALTLERGFGDCKDKTTLFVALARQVGLDAYPVLTSTDRNNPAKLLVPAASYFNHMVACARLPDGKEICADLTDPVSPAGTLQIQGAIRLDLVDDPEPPSRFPTDPFARQMQVHVSNQLDDQGNVLERTTRQFTGPMNGTVRGWLQGKNKAQREKALLKDYHHIFTSSVDPEFSVHGVDELGPSVMIRTKANFSDAFDPDALEIYTDREPELLEEFRLARSQNRFHDYEFTGLEYRGRTVYQLPTNRKVGDTGPRLNLNSPYGLFSRTYSVVDGGLTVLTHVQIPRRVIPVEQIPRFNRFLREMRNNARIWFALKK